MIDPTIRRTRRAGFVERSSERRRHLFGGILDLVSTASDPASYATDASSAVGDLGSAFNSPADFATGALTTATNAADTAASSGGGGLGGLFSSIGNMLGLGGANAPSLNPAIDGSSYIDPTTGESTPIPPTPPGYDPNAGAAQNDVNIKAAMNNPSLVASSGVSSGINKTALALAALAALGSAFSKPKQGTWATPGPASAAANTGPYYNATLNQPGVAAPAPGRQATAPGLPTGAQPNYWTYGGPEQTYFQGNSLHNFGFAHGGNVQQPRGALAMAHGGAEFATGHGENHVRGPGDGTSDSVPARLSDGEYVLTARDVSAIGMGSNDAGAKKLDQFRDHLANASGQKKFIPAKAGGALNQLARSV